MLKLYKYLKIYVLFDIWHQSLDCILKRNIICVISILFTIYNFNVVNRTRKLICIGIAIMYLLVLDDQVTTII